MGKPRAEQHPDGTDLRRRWLRLGARELLIAREFLQRPSARPGPCSSEVVWAAAADVLADTGLAARAGAFDPLVAWEHQAAALSALIPVCARALRGDGDAAHSVHDILVDRLARVVSVLWLIDNQSPPPRTDAETDPGVQS